jgi:hypothetical protein
MKHVAHNLIITFHYTSNLLEWTLITSRCNIIGSQGEKYKDNLMMETERTSETSVYFHETIRRYI